MKNIFIGFLILLNASCTRYYFPDQPHLLRLEKKGAIKAAGSLGLIDGLQNNLQVSYSPIPSLGIQSSFTLNAIDLLNRNLTNNISQFNVALGYNKNFNQKKRMSKGNRKVFSMDI